MDIITLEHPRHPVSIDIEQRQDEPPHAFDLFCVYLCMQKRSLRVLAEQSHEKTGTAVSFQQIGKYSADYAWQQRTMAFDKAVRDEVIDVLLPMRTEHFLEIWEIEMGVVKKFMQEIDELINDYRENHRGDYKRLRWLVETLRHLRAVSTIISEEQEELWGDTDEP